VYSLEGLFSLPRVVRVRGRGELAILLALPGDMNSGGWMGTVARVPLEGGEPRPLIENACAADWSPDGQELGGRPPRGRRGSARVPDREGP
jgi:hypothetical protein